MSYTLKRLRYLIDVAVEVPCISEWIKGVEKKSREIKLMPEATIQHLRDKIVKYEEILGK